ncbi:hypothetical protein [Kitasatospora terrestris]|uniref:Lipoprotein n=1 Tax=Kitasatospora terrestris TaxID=258051 RepID=A0ABP9DMG3_9ACTN
MRTRTRGVRPARALLAAAAAGLALTLAGCSGGGAAPIAQNAVEKAAELAPEALLKAVGDRTSAAKSAKVESDIKAGDGVMHFQGAISWQDGLQGELKGSATGGKMGQALSQVGGDGTFTARYLSDAYYVNMGDAMARQLQGKHWLRYGYEDMATLMGASGDALRSQFKSADPVAAVRTLIASGKVAKVGEESVNGTKATKYQGDFTAADLDRMATNGLTADQVKALKTQFEQTVVGADHVEVWVGADQLLLKKVESFETKAGHFEAASVYSGYGTPVETKAPAKADTVDFAELLKAAQQGAATG